MINLYRFVTEEGLLLLLRLTKIILNAKLCFTSFQKIGDRKYNITVDC